MCPRLVLPLLLLTVAVPCRALDVRVSAFSQLGEGEELHGGTLIVSVPFERWAAGSRASVASRAHPTEASNALHLPASAAAPAAPAAAPAAPAAAAAAPAAPAAVEDQRTSILSAAAVPAPVWQPPFSVLRRLVAAAVIEHERRAARLESLSSRSKSSAWLPTVRVRAGRNVDQTVRLTPTLDDPDRWQLTGGADLRFEAQLSWHFDRLLFADEELAVERLRLQASVRRERLVEAVLEWLLRWQSARVEASDPLGEPRSLQLAQVRAAHAQSVLDVLTAGWFSAHLSELAGPLLLP